MKAVLNLTALKTLVRSPSLSLLLSLGLGLAVLMICLGSGIFAMRNFRQEKMRDTLAIMYLELERTALGVEREAHGLASSVGLGQLGDVAGLRAPDAAARVNADLSLTAVRGKLPKEAHLAKPSSGSVRNADDQLILQFSGEDYLARVTDATETRLRLGEAVAAGRYVLLWRTNVAEWVGTVAGRGSASRVYLLTRDGAMLYSNRDDVTAANYLSRPLVQKFIDAPLRLGQVGFKDDKGDDWYGFFYEVPGTNVVAFAEAPSSVALAPVRAALTRFVLVMLAALVFALILLQLFLGVVTAPITRLMQLTWQVAAGVFDIDIDAKGCREIQELALCFRDMSGSLASRDIKIQELMVEQLGKIRLESEIELARTVQKNLLPGVGLKKTSGLDLSILYLPMTELAGDWYGHAISDDGDETTVALADISGHGAGSAMFMTLIAGAFEELRLSHGGAPSPLAFIEKTHTLIHAVGKGAWHATMVVFKYRRSTGEIHIVGAGHPFPVLSSVVDGKRASTLVRLPSTYVGGDRLEYARADFKLERGMTLAIYSDGLVEAQNALGRRFGSRRLKEVFTREGTAQSLVDYASKQWRGHLNESPADDDCCLLVARAI